MRIGYARVSTRDQHPEAQHDALTAAGCEHVFIDKASGKLARRPELDKALLVARTGDQLVVTKLDRLGRSLEHLIALSGELHDRGVDLVVLDQGIDTSTAIGRMFFQILGAIAEFEHSLMSERTLDGLEAARARGRTGGQKPKLGPRQVTLARQMYDETGPDGKRRYTVAQIAEEFGVSRPTIYRHLEPGKPGQTTTKDSRVPGEGSQAHPVPTHEEITAPVTKPVSPTPTPKQASRDETRQAVTESERAERQEQERRQAEADRERAEFERRLRPVPEVGEGYQMAEWPGTGHYYLVHEGERIGYATKTTYGTQWEAYTRPGAKVPGSRTYKTRHDALVEVDLHHRHTTRRSKKPHR